jgi:hypothetical protein
MVRVGAWATKAKAPAASAHLEEEKGGESQGKGRLKSPPNDFSPSPRISIEKSYESESANRFGLLHSFISCLLLSKNLNYSFCSCSGIAIGKIGRLWGDLTIQFRTS